MSRLFPFCALRPTPASAAAVAAVPYDVVSASEARALARGNPLSFLHVSRAEIDLPEDVDPYSSQVYARAAVNFEALKTSAPLVVEDVPSVYIYRLRMGSHEQTGVASCYSMEEYDRDLIKKHERTRRDKEDDRTAHMQALRAQTGPVFLAYSASRDVNEVVARTTAQAPLLDVTAADEVQHTIWRVATADQQALVLAFGAVPALYIADGHHRAASAARARQELRGAAGAAGAWDTFLAVAFPDNQTQILPYNRVVKDLGAETAETLLAKIGERHVVRKGGSTPTTKGDVSMYLAGRWHTIALGSSSGTPGVGSRDADNPGGDDLDVSRLQDGVLTPLLHIGDVRTDKRIDFVGGARGTVELERLVDSGKAAVAFSMYPVSVTDLMAIADAGGIMPPKSTWFEPKLRDGLLVHLI